jgi:glycosyltransferase involved in cell wall biosynthesis
MTMRDYMHLCSGGAICLHDEDLPPRRCSLAQYRKCFQQFQKKYHPHAGAWKRLKASVRHVVETLDVKTRQWVLRRADRIVTVSNAVGRIHLAAGLLSEEPVTVYNVPPERVPADGEGETRARWGVPENAPLVLYVGKQSFGKGTDVLLEAARRVLEASPSVHFLLVGRKEPLIPIPRDPRVIATGPLPHEQVMKLYPAADVVVLPAVWKEPFPRSLLEAMTFGKPVVATRAGGIPELVVDEESGILVPPKDADALARALRRVCDDRALAERLGRRGRMRLENDFSASSSLSRLLSVYEDLAAGGS